MAGSRVLRTNGSRLLPPFLISPSPARLSCGAAAAFSTTAPKCKRKTKDNNPQRGVSSLYRSGPREPLSMSSVPLPRPRDHKQTIKVDDDHGLWGFFPKPGKAIHTPSEAEAHGRGWTVEELRKKSWEDLHALWWVCCRERNMIATGIAELKRAKLGFGEKEFVQRDMQVQRTQRSIKHALTERMYTWQDAVEVAKTDPEINLEGGEGELYQPSQYEDDMEGQRGWTEEVDAADPTTTGAPGAEPQAHDQGKEMAR